MPISPPPEAIPSRLSAPYITSPQINPSASPFLRLYLPQIYPPQKPPETVERAVNSGAKFMLLIRKKVSIEKKTVTQTITKSPAAADMPIPAHLPDHMLLRCRRIKNLRIQNYTS